MDKLTAMLQLKGLHSERTTPNALDNLDQTKGAYILFVTLERAVAVKLPGRDAFTLSVGTYLYVGSANGGGGMKARLARHFKRQKEIHWHVDQLTTRAAHVSALAVADGDECMLGAVLINSGRFQVAVPGFGSSDCRTCVSHLLMPV
ncbi:GIY-YIG nuclease family protein [Kordiimonas aquimaris]|uniref:GIY-YIG nuclease family protein n=1 Tax=Kordiimonas aquimaris TaxID=707591 RepID=UPI0021CF6B9C|nr:GIY-YIG nuclease family protein [Kordiimonas aquimaris]